MEGESFAGFGVVEFQVAGVEREASDVVFAFLIALVANDGQLDVGQLDANLMATTGDQGAFEQGSIAAAAHDTVVRDGFASPIAGRSAADQVPIAFVEMGTEGPFIGGRLAGDDREILFGGMCPVVLQGHFSGFGFGEDHQSRSFLVESMDDPDSMRAMGLSAAYVIGEHGIGRFLSFGVAGHAQQIGRLINHNECIVFVDNLQASSDFGGCSSLFLGADRHFITRLQGMTGVSDSAVIDVH